MSVTHSQSILAMPAAGVAIARNICPTSYVSYLASFLPFSNRRTQFSMPL
ncbi:hypothetical protein [Nostoc sp.]